MSSKALDRVDYVEFYVGSAKQWAYYHKFGLGFNIVAYAGAETGIRDRTSYLVEQGNVKILLTSPMQPDSSISDHVRMHGDGVKDIAIKVNDIDSTLNEIKERKIVKHSDPTKIKTDNGLIEKSTAFTYGETVHSLLDYGEYDGKFPRFSSGISGETKRSSPEFPASRYFPSMYMNLLTSPENTPLPIFI